MTNEEAIQEFEEEIEIFGGEHREAMLVAIEALKREIPRGTYQCFHCGSYSVIWGADFDFSDYGLEGEGIVHSCHCANCGADIEYYVRLDNDDTM